MKKKLFDMFAELFGDSEGARFYFSPGRVNLIGEHTDYNGGHVFPCALTLGTYGAARKREDNKIHFYSMNLDSFGVVEASLDDLTNKKEYNWANYPLGVVWAFKEKGHTITSGFDMVIWGNIPNGSGLSSSASLEVLTGVILTDLFEIKDLSMTDLALIGQYSENNFNGCNCGIMDQFAVAMGKKDHAIFLDTSDLSYEYAPCVLDGAKIVITNSKVKHSLVDSAYNDRRNECAAALKALQSELDIQALGDLTPEEFEAHKSLIKDEIQLQRAKHAVYENQRTIDAVTALKAGDIESFGKLMNQSHISLRDDYDVSCEEIDILVDLAWKIPGVLGSRITGGGFGGCTVSIVKDESIDTFIETIGKTYLEKVGHEAEFYTVDIGDGASRLD
ncbi:MULTISPECIES: galactokinase [Mediterraneibacter]|uniref:galactokinase n=1 Tax=Mediterraneibacter TaxID=2316020 RepID=UPI000E504B7E|nr:MULTISPECIES: galactokinase [Mediterraneibacter]RGG22164.1 galactokinase [Ruminococcus sp. AF25-3LB]RGG31494.1 galactokinase [Ruminococcus sp. AF25-17]RGH45990.1 galactokinase [Ruminococcus sp. AM41-2AC]RGH93527.1 galactokinase [Ruminococcus sp. AM27-27]RGH97500.1 galactokinase [Ruminococcus sp. AM27-11LB]RGI29656.1 galactokinase [Ruminococcus sp. OM08-13AT]RGI56512.1 galactokinase [Ruminococcus sp. OF05-2BH]